MCPNEDDDEDWEVPEENKESDMELKLHVLGFKAIWSQSHGIVSV